MKTEMFWLTAVLSGVVVGLLAMGGVEVEVVVVVVEVDLEEVGGLEVTDSVVVEAVIGGEHFIRPESVSNGKSDTNWKIVCFIGPSLVGA